MADTPHAARLILSITTRCRHGYRYPDVTNVREAKHELRWINARGERRSMALAFIRIWDVTPVTTPQDGTPPAVVTDVSQTTQATKGEHEMNTIISETPIEFGGQTFTARRNTGPEERYQIFIDDEFTPVGYIEVHIGCGTHSGEHGFRVFDTNNAPLFVAKKGKDDGCVHSYKNALLPFVVERSQRKSKTRVVQSVADFPKWQAQYFDPSMSLWFDIGDAKKDIDDAEKLCTDYAEGK